MRPEHHLTLKPRAADFVVDLSNVVRDRKLCDDRPANLQRFLGLIEALAAYTRDETVQVYAVADRSLLKQHALTAQERATLHRWYQQGLIEVRPRADDRILELADTTGLYVVSNDRYVGDYRKYPWIAGNPDQFFRQVPGPGGIGVGITPNPMPTPAEHEISRKEEQDRLVAAHMYDRRTGTGARQELLTRLWLCPVPDCPMFGPDPVGGQPAPVFDGAVVRCPTHRERMTDLGPTPSRVQVKVRIEGVVRYRFMLVAGTAVVVGRAPAESGVALTSPILREQDLDRISREHVELTWDGSRISVRDLSRNGTWLRRDGAAVLGGPDAGGDDPAPGPRSRIPRGRTWQLRSGQVVVLCDDVELVPSGRRYVFDADPGIPAPVDAVRAQADQKTGFYRSHRR
ncbi:FHA domain-containing protein [Plantactinospora sp. B5E13]|uniref:FHA domain-containing protein n=1 Tax=unclassified Plantactinospora TaxID=2631981 RepID=UPI00325E3895